MPSSTRSVSLREAPPVFVTIGKTRYQLEVTDEKGRVVNKERDWAPIAKKMFTGQPQAPVLFATLEGDFSPVDKKCKAEERSVKIKKMKYDEDTDATKYANKIEIEPKTKKKIEKTIGKLLGSYAPAKPSKTDIDAMDEASDEDSSIDDMDEEEEVKSIKLPAIPAFPEKPASDALEAKASLPLFLNNHGLATTPANDLFSQIQAQASGMTKKTAIDSSKLRQKTAEKLAKTPANQISQEDCTKMHAILLPTNKSLLLTSPKPFLRSAKTLKAAEVNALFAPGKPAPAPGSTEAKLLTQAFANYMYNATNSGAHHDYPPFFYEALDAVLKDDKKVDGIVIVKGAKPNFKIVHVGTRTGTLNPSRSIFLGEHAATGYSQFDRSTLNGITTDPSILAHSADAKIATHYRDKQVKIKDNGDCAAESLADALFQKDKQYYSKAAWDIKVKEKGLELRHDVMNHLYENPEKFHEESDFAQVISAFNQLMSNKSAFKTGIPDKKTRKAIEKLTGRTPAKYTAEEKNFLIQTYALYGATPKRSLDGLFFLGFAKLTDHQIVVVKKVAGNAQIASLYTKEPIEGIKKEECLFIYYKDPADGASTGHYNSLNRGHKFFKDGKECKINGIIKQYNAINLAPSFHRNALIEALSDEEPDTAAVKQCLDNVKEHDIQGYLALQAHFGKPALEKGASAITKLLKGPKNLKTIMQTGSHLESRAKFYATLKGFKTGDAEFIQKRIIELKKCDPVSYLMLEELLEGKAPESKVKKIRAMHSKKPMVYFEKEIEKRPYLSARAAFFQALEKARTTTSPENEKALVKAIKRLENKDLQGYLSLTEMYKLGSTALAQSLINSTSTTEQIVYAIKQTARTESYLSAYQILAKAIKEFAKDTKNSEKKAALIHAIENLKATDPLSYMRMSISIKQAKPEDHLDLVLANAKTKPLFPAFPAEYTKVFAARRDFFQALKLHELKTGKAYKASVADALAELKTNDRNGYAIVCQLAGGEKALKKDRALLKAITLDKFQEKLFASAAVASHSSESDSSSSEEESINAIELGSSGDDTNNPFNLNDSSDDDSGIRSSDEDAPLQLLEIDDDGTGVGFSSDDD
jgi:hypothetical protein